MLFNPDFKEMLRALSDAKIDFLLVGAYAVAAPVTHAQLATLIFGSVPTQTLLGRSIAFSPSLAPH